MDTAPSTLRGLRSSRRRGRKRVSMLADRKFLLSRAGHCTTGGGADTEQTAPILNLVRRDLLDLPFPHDLVWRLQRKPGWWGSLKTKCAPLRIKPSTIRVQAPTTKSKSLFRTQPEVLRIVHSLAETQVALSIPS